MENEEIPGGPGEGDNEGETEATSDGPAKRKGRKRKMPESEKWGRTHIANRLMVWTTAVVAFGTLFYAGAAAFQIYVLKQSAAETSHQTDKLIAASEQLAVIANRQAEGARKANEEMLAKAERFTRANEELVKTASKQADASMSQAKTSQVSASAAKESAAIAGQALAIGERPYMAVKQYGIKNFEAGKTPTIEVFFDNTGKTPALNVHCRTWGTLRIERKLGRVAYAETAELSEVVVQSQGIVKQVIPLFNEKLPPEAVKSLVEAVKRKEAWLFIYGIVEYDDSVGRRHTLKFCGVYDADKSETDYCTEHNSSN